MSAWKSLIRSGFGTLIVAALVSGCNSGGTGTPPATSPAVPATVSHRFTQATQTEKARPRPSITNRNVVYCHGAKDNCYSFQLVQAVGINDDGTFSNLSNTCDSSIFDAPWYFANSSSTLPIAVQVAFPVCTPPQGSSGSGDDLMRPNAIRTPTPTPAPGSTPSAQGQYYLVKIDIGWFSLNVGAIAGPASINSVNEWVLPSLPADNAFQAGHLYAFFIAAFNGQNCPVPVASP